MIIFEHVSEEHATIQTAKIMCQAARTAPKAKGLDYIHTAILLDEDKDNLADVMEQLGNTFHYSFFLRDAKNVRESTAVVLIGITNTPRGLNEGCQFCGFKNCQECINSGGQCAYTGIDLGTAIGSAVSIAADFRVDNRVMFSIGRAAIEMNIMGNDICQCIGIPLSATGKSPLFDRK